MTKLSDDIGQSLQNWGAMQGDQKYSGAPTRSPSFIVDVRPQTKGLIGRHSRNCMSKKQVSIVDDDLLISPWISRTFDVTALNAAVSASPSTATMASWCQLGKSNGRY